MNDQGLACVMLAGLETMAEPLNPSLHPIKQREAVGTEQQAPHCGNQDRSRGNIHV